MITMYGHQLKQVTQNRIKEVADEGFYKQKLFTDKFFKKLIDKGIFYGDSSKPMPVDSIDNDEPVTYKRQKQYSNKISTAGLVMFTGSLAKGGLSYGEQMIKNDKPAATRALYSSAINGAILMVGMTQPALAVSLSLVNYLTNNLVGNSIQNRYDNQRLNYKMANYDFDKYSTYVYNDGKAVAQDTQRVNNTILNRNKIS